MNLKETEYVYIIPTAPESSLKQLRGSFNALVLHLPGCLLYQTIILLTSVKLLVEAPDEAMALFAKVFAIFHEHISVTGTAASEKHANTSNDREKSAKPDHG